ncbi:MAG: 2-oxoglutarate dehydrogenase complex dihydrolipoyllysine-residue succinyltransferase [Phycisphaerales bacterium]
MTVEVKIPEVGESVTEALIAKWLKSEGDQVEKDEALVELETDKVTVEAPAPAGGVIERIVIQEGESAKVGDVIAYIDESSNGASKKSGAASESKKDGKAKSADADDEDADQEEAEEKASKKSKKKDSDDPKSKKKSADHKSDADDSDSEEKPDSADIEVSPRVMPAAQRALAEHGLDAKDIKGTGPGGRVLKEDVLRHVEDGNKKKSDSSDDAKGDAKSSRTATPQTTSAGDRDEESVPMSPMRRRIAQRLVEAQQTAALLTTFNEIDMSAVMALRKTYREQFEKKYDIRLGFMSFFVKAVVEGLKELPQINAMIKDDSVVYRHYYDIGIAVSTDKGLVVPIIRNAERLGFAEIEQTINDFAQRARSKKLELEELEGGTFSITNGGVFGSLLSTPIINPPQSGILGLHAIQDRPVAIDGEVKIRPMMYVALTYDHRIVDGREAVTFLRRVKETIEDPTRIMLEV